MKNKLQEQAIFSCLCDACLWQLYHQSCGEQGSELHRLIMEEMTRRFLCSDVTDNCNSDVS